jgi:hypothetical protein
MLTIQDTIQRTVERHEYALPPTNAPTITPDTPDVMTIVEKVVG